jgi:hypothetical protein
MRMKMKKRQVINHRFRSVSHSAFVTPEGFQIPFGRRAVDKSFQVLLQST